MKKYNIDASDENILNTIMFDQISRSQDVKDFLEMLDTIEYNTFISVDAAWGEGKTFFIRQVEMTMRYYNKKMFDKEITEQEINAFSKNGHLSNLELKHTYYPIYFDSWLYDNHPNALMALLMVAIKQCNKYINTMFDTGIMKKATSILDSVQFWKSSNWSNLLESFKSENILEETLLLEEIRQKVKEIFNDILVEAADKLIFFIDELDRCRPTFAIEMLVLHPASSQTITGYSLANLVRASCVLNCQLIFTLSALRLTVHIRTCCLKLSKSGHGFPNACRLMIPISISAMSSQLPCFGV